MPGAGTIYVGRSKEEGGRFKKTLTQLPSYLWTPDHRSKMNMLIIQVGAW